MFNPFHSLRGRAKHKRTPRRPLGHLWRAFVLAPLLLLPSMGDASMPVMLRLVVVSQDKYAEATSRAYALFLAENGNFIAMDAPYPALFPADVAKCSAAEEDVEGCVRALLGRLEGPQDLPPVAIIVRSLAGATVAWQCIGVGPPDPSSRWREARIDLQAAMFGKPDRRIAERQLALNCIFAAGAEAGGRIAAPAD